MSVMKMKHVEDPAQVVFEKAGMKKGKIPGVELMANRVLLGIYELPEKTDGGIIIPQSTKKENKYQGKAAVVLAKGPTAFVSDDHFDFRGQTVEIGDWVSLSVTDGKAIKVNDADCRLIRDQDISMKIPGPDTVY